MARATSPGTIPELLVDRCGLAFDHRDRGDEPLGRWIPETGKLRCARSVWAAGWRPGGDFDLAEAVFFDPGVGHALLLAPAIVSN